MSTVITIVGHAFWGFVVLKAAWYIHVGLTNIGQGVGQAILDGARIAAGKPTSFESSR